MYAVQAQCWHICVFPYEWTTVRALHHISSVGKSWTGPWTIIDNMIMMWTAWQAHPQCDTQE